MQSVSWLQPAACISWQYYCSPITVSKAHHADHHHPLGNTLSDATSFNQTFSSPDNCATGMGESQYSYQGLPDPSSYFSGAGGGGGGSREVLEPTGTPNIFIHDNSALAEGLQTPNTRARRVVHEVIV